MKISVTVIALNEEANIEECLKSVMWADEIVLMDSKSTDRTVEIAKEFTDRIIVEENWKGYGKQKNRCAEKAKNDWILNIDADEIVSEELKDEILRLDSQGLKYTSYSVIRKNFIGGRWIKYGGWYPDRIIRLYNRNEAIFTETLVHEGIRRKGKIGILNGHLIHKTYKSIDDYFIRQDRYSHLSAKDMAFSKRGVHLRNLVLRPLFSFFKNYILKMGFLEGYYGLVLAYGQALYTYKKYAALIKFDRKS